MSITVSVNVSLSPVSSCKCGSLTLTSGWSSTTSSFDNLNSSLTIQDALAGSYVKVHSTTSLSTARSAFGSLPSANGYTNSGWQYTVNLTYSDGSTRLYQSGNTPNCTYALVQNPPSNTTRIAVTLQPRWVASSSGGSSTSYIVRFELNGGGTLPENLRVQTFSPGAYITLPTPTPYSGNTFDGWFESERKVVCDPGERHAVNRDYFYYAQWIKTTTPPPSPPPTPTTTYTLSYMLNGGTGLPPNQTTTTYGAQLTVSSKTPTKGSLTFLGWALDDSSGSPSYHAGDKITMNGDHKLYAIWSTPQCTITYINGSDERPYTYDKGATIYLASRMFGQYHIGWSKTANSKTVSYQFGAQYTLSADTKMYAVMETPPPVEWTVTFNPNGTGATCTTKERKVQDGKAVGTLPTASWTPSTEYTFDGWYSQRVGGTKYTTDTKVYSDVVLYAHWTAKPLGTLKVTASPTKVKRGNDVSVNWTITGNNLVFKVEYKVNNASSWSTLISSTSEKKCAYTTGSTFERVIFRVTATSSSTSASPVTAESNEVTVDQGTIPGRVSKCTVKSNENDSGTIFTNSGVKYYDVSWTELTDATGNMTGYELQMRTSNNQTWRDTERHGKSILNRAPLCDTLKGATWVQWRVRAIDQYGRDTEWRESNQCPVADFRKPEWVDYGWIKYPVPTAPNVRSGESFKIQWSLATDPDGDLYRYILAREDNENGNWTTNTFTILSSNVKNGQPEWTDRITSKNITKIRYRVYAEDSTQQRTTVITGAVVPVLHNTPPNAPQWIRAQVEQNAIDAGHPNTMEPLKGGEYNRILWARAVDIDNNLAGYQLECSFDGEAFKVIKGYTQGTAPLDTFFNFLIPKSATERHDTAQFRVKAKDSYDAESPYIMSRTYNISNNSTPVVDGEYGNREYIGSRENAFPITYSVTDEDLDEVEIEIAVYDGNAKLKTLAKFNAQTPYFNKYEITDKEFSELPMRRLTVRITARDSEGMGEYWFDFTRKGTRAAVSLKTPVKYSEHITGVMFTALEGSFPSDCRLSVEVTNNANDPLGGRWEDCTQAARNKMLYTFQNKIATYGPAFNFRISAARGPSGQSGYIRRVAGYFETVTGKGPMF